MPHNIIIKATITVCALAMTVTAAVAREQVETKVQAEASRFPAPNIGQLPLVGITAMMQDSEGYVWYASTEGGLCRDNGYQVEIFRNNRRQTQLLGHSNGVLSLCETSRGDICFGTRENIYLLRKSDYSIAPLDPQVNKGKVRIVRRTPSGGLVALTGSGEVTYDRDYRRLSTAVTSLTEQQITDSAQALYGSFVDRKGNLWEIDDAQPYITMCRDTLLIERKEPDGTTGVQDLHSCTSQSGTLFTGDSDGIRVGRKYVSGLSNIRQIVAAPQGGAYFISARAALGYCSEAAEPTTLVSGGESKNLCVSPDGTVWIGGWQGQVWRYDPTASTLVLDEQASTANSDPVNALAVDWNGHLWIVADKYIKVYDPQTCQYRTLPGSSRHIRITQLLSAVPQGRSMAVAGSDGCLIVGCQNTPAQENLALTDMVVDGQKVYTPQHCTSVTVGAEVTSVELHFSTFDHPDASDIAMSYRLDGGRWIELPIGSNAITLSALAKGIYRVEVKATNGLDGRVATMQLGVERLPAWWETWWAYTAYLLLLAAAILTIGHAVETYRNTQRKVAELQARLERFLRKDEAKLDMVAEQITDNKADRDFIDRAVALIEQNIADADFDIDALCLGMGLSKSGLYRKFAGITGQKPTEFIRSIRLKRATELIREGRLSMSEIAYQCGFSSPSYFNKRFKEMFGVNPSEYHR